MNRRTFGLWLSGLVAAFLGLLGLRWRPRHLLEAQEPPRVIPEPVDVILGQAPVEEIVETDIYVMLDHIVDHVALTGESVLAFDDPMTRRLGWTCETKAWQISLTKLKGSLATDPPFEGYAVLGVIPPTLSRELLRAYIPTAEGRVKIAAAMEGAGLARRRAHGVSGTA